MLTSHNKSLTFAQEGKYVTQEEAKKKAGLQKKMEELQKQKVFIQFLGVAEAESIYSMF